MDLIFQILLLTLIFFSLILVIAVPYVCSITNGWEDNKKFILVLTTIWFSLVLFIGTLNSFVI